jgi:rhamnogalacturonyl hydrolase YesR
MMNALVRVQDETGVWRQLLDRPEAWLEASGSAMFTYALVTGVAEGWLDPGDYGPPARAAWLGLTSFIDQRGEVREVCVGTGEASYEVGPDRDAQIRYYLDRPRVTGDMHGQGPAAWSAAALLRHEIGTRAPA